MTEVAWLIPALALGAWVVILLVGKRLPDGGSWVGILAVAAGWVMSTAILLGFVSGEAEPYHRSWTWASFGAEGIEIPAGFIVDGLTAVLLVVVTTISLLVQVYSLGYMRGDSRYTFFFAKLSLFTAGMLIVVLADSLLLLLVGWEIMGICSYFLIGHYWEEHANSRAAIKAFLTTRVGDIGFMLGIAVLFWAARSFEIEAIARAVEEGRVAAGIVTLGAVLIFCGAIGKSGQFPLHTWLPDAMAGPTPVSALIHAATMVAAGVFLVARMYPVFEASAVAMNEIAVIGTVTMLIAALLALVQDDIKRVLAYSTVSQLAYMMAGLGVGGLAASIFHLFTHAFFKALLFLAAGQVIHAVHTNDMRHMGGLRRSMPATFWTFTIGALALAGVPPLAGFWSKDEILHHAWLHGFGGGEAGLLTSPGVAQAVFVVGVVTAFLTALYVARMLWLTFGGAYRGEGHPHEAGAVMLTPVTILAIGAVLAGLVGSPLAGERAFASWIAPGAEAPSLDLTVATISVLVALAGLGFGSLLYRRGLEGPDLAAVPVAGTALRRKYFIDDLYEGVFVRAVTGVIAPAVNWFDQRVIDGIVNGLGAGTGQAGRGLRHVQTGQAQWYAAALFVGVIGLAVIVTRFAGS